MIREPQAVGLREQVLLAALECSRGDCGQTFTAEELLVNAWEKDKKAWGLRGFESDYPDSAKIYKELDAHAGKQGIVGRGLLRKVHHRVYQLTPAGLAAASTLRPSDRITREKAGRQLEQRIKRILEHPTFRLWLSDPERPKRFREAGHFWGIAPGMPPKTVRERVGGVEQTLGAAADFLRRAGASEVAQRSGKTLFERSDIERCLEFQATLKKRFERDLRLLDPKIEL